MKVKKMRRVLQIKNLVFMCESHHKRFLVGSELHLKSLDWVVTDFVFLIYGRHIPECLHIRIRRMGGAYGKY